MDETMENLGDDIVIPVDLKLRAIAAFEGKLEELVKRLTQKEDWRYSGTPISLKQLWRFPAFKG